MPICPTCQTRFEGEEQFCPLDGTPLSPTQPSDVFIGRVLGGRYRLTERLGQGGMGTVYRAVHTLMDKAVAVKILRVELAGDAEALARFHREARSASRLDHDHCIRVTDFGQSDDGQLYLVMELLEGESLGQHLRRVGRLPPLRAAAIGLAVAEALAHAHEAGVIHRDLKPDNVFLARRPRGRAVVKVLDFGLAKLMREGSLGPGASITRDGTVFGTPEYMAPEQAEGESLDGRTDIYALGCILYQMVTGVPPFQAQSFVALLTKQVEEPPVPPSVRCPEAEVGPDLEALILRCLAKRPSDRYETAAGLAQALDPIAPQSAGDAISLADVSRPDPLPPPAAAPPLAPTRPMSFSTAGSTGASSGAPVAASDSQIRGEVLERPRLARRLAAVVGGALVVGAAAVASFGPWRLPWMVIAPSPSPVVTAAATATPPGELLLERGEALLVQGNVPAAAELAERSAAAQPVAAAELEARVAETRGERLRALVEQHRALRSAPKGQDAAVRGRLAALLLRLGQRGDACKQARAAIAAPAVDSTSAQQARDIAQLACTTR